MSDKQNSFPFSDSSEINLHDISREMYPEPCPDCNREHLNGEHIIWRIIVKEPGATRIAWEGCVDCWIRRTNPVITV